MFLRGTGIKPPERSRFVLDQASAALRAGDFTEAELTLRKHLLAAPRDAQALAMLAALVATQHRTEEAAMLLRRAAAVDPSPARDFALVRQLLELAGPTVALAEVQSFSPTSRKNLEMRNFEALLLGLVGKLDEQLAHFDRMAKDHPRVARIWIERASPLNSAGRTEDAVASLRRAIALDPESGEAYWALANLKVFQFTDGDIIAMRKLLADAHEGSIVSVHFALGRALEQRGEVDQSFEHYAAGNRIIAGGTLPEQMRVTAFVDATMGAFDGKLFNRFAGAACAEPGPIFIVGLHRSGSTLIEQILASHPDIEGLGELPALQQIWERVTRSAARTGRDPLNEMASWEPAAFLAIGAEYLERVAPFRSTRRPWFTDKLPANWLRTGLIRRALPNARIIDARRHPLACGFSNFKQHYGVGVTYSYSLASIGQFYRDYLRLMDHFDRLQPGAILHIVNEKLIENPERELRRMLRYVGVPYDPSCLEFHTNNRAVQTPSAQQVRRPINRDGIDSWRPYEPWLRDLKDALGPALEEWMP